MILTPDSPVFIVHGPTAEWADGTGPLAFFLEHPMAESFITDERRSLAEDDLLERWPYNFRDYDIEVSTLGAIMVPANLLVSGPDAVVEYLNEW